MNRLWYELRLSTRGGEEWRSLASSLGVMDLTLPAFDNEPCDGTFSHPFSVLNVCRCGGSYKRSQIVCCYRTYIFEEK